MTNWFRLRRRIRTRLVAGIAAALGFALMLSGCGQIQVTTVNGSPEGPTLAIGVAADEPAIGAWHDGTYEGFDISVAKYVAAKLGYANKQIVFKQVRPANRASMLNNGQVDMVVASWAITDGSKAEADFAGPYLRTGVGLLIRTDDRADFAQAGDGIGDIADRMVCIVKGDDTADLFRANPSQGPIPGTGQLRAMRHRGAGRISRCHRLRHGGAVRSATGQWPAIYDRAAG